MADVKLEWCALWAMVVARRKAVTVKATSRVGGTKMRKRVAARWVVHGSNEDGPCAEQ